MDSLEKLFPHLVNWEKTRKGKFTLRNLKDETMFFESPQFKFKTIHIAGSKGKGTLSYLLSLLIKNLGYKVGCFTSPHVFKVEERIQFNGNSIPTEELSNYSQIIKKIIGKYKKYTQLTYFEILTLISFLYFRDKKVDFAIYETGIGGMFDATNLVESDFQIITSIEYEHTEILGFTLEKIFLQKLGIGKSQSPLLILDVPSYLFSLLIPYYEKKNKNIYIYNKDFGIKKYNNSLEYYGIYNVYRFSNLKQLTKKLPVSISGALFVAEYITGKKLPHTIVQKTLKNFRSAYRLQIICKKPLIVFDVAHTRQSAKNLVESLKSIYPNTKFCTLFSSMRNKDVIGMLFYLRHITKRFIFCSNLSKNSFSSEELVNLNHTYIFSECDSFVDINEAVNYICKNNLFPLIVCGSFYNIATVKNKIARYLKCLIIH